MKKGGSLFRTFDSTVVWSSGFVSLDLSFDDSTTIVWDGIKTYSVFGEYPNQGRNI